MTEPILLGLAPAIVTGVIAAIANLLKTFGIADITDDQLAAINDLAVKVMIALGAIGIWWARRHATPVSSPTLPEGTQVKVTTAPGEDDRTVTL